MFSKSCKYAIRAVLHIARHTDREKRLGLTRDHLITSIKGAGGFYLAPENQEASLEDVIRCIDGEDLFTSCALGLPVCSSDKPCPLHCHTLAFRQSIEQMKSIPALARDIR